MNTRKLLASAILPVALMSGTAQARPPVIGDHWGGGIVFYVTPNKQHGLIAQSSDLCNQVQMTFYNMEDAVKSPVCQDREAQNFTDWRIPTYAELARMYATIGQGPKAVRSKQFPYATNVGHFANESYWSASEWRDVGIAIDRGDAYSTTVSTFDFGSEDWQVSQKVWYLKARAIRSF